MRALMSETVPFYCDEKEHCCALSKSMHWSRRKMTPVKHRQCEFLQWLWLWNSSNDKEQADEMVNSQHLEHPGLGNKKSAQHAHRFVLSTFLSPSLGVQDDEIVAQNLSELGWMCHHIRRLTAIWPHEFQEERFCFLVQHFLGLS